MTLSAEQIAQRWNEYAKDLSPTEPSATDVRPPQYVRHLADVSESLIEALRVEDGIGLGLAQIDVLTRGFRPTDLAVITGFAHSGKTQLVNTMLCNSPDKRVLFFSLDDPAEMILAKLVAMRSGIGADRIEQYIKGGDEGVIRLVRETADEHFPNLIVVDEVIGIPAMQVAIDEATDLWAGASPDAIVLDYVEMMPGGAVSEQQASNVKVKMNDLKAWAKTLPCPLIVVHQGTRSNAKPGEPITLLSLGFSGEQQATIIIGVRRKRDQEDLEAWERQNHQDTVTLHVVKNKRPGGRCTHHEGIDFHMDAATGLITPERDGTTLSAARAVQTSMEITGDD